MLSTHDDIGDDRYEDRNDRRVVDKQRRGARNTDRDEKLFVRAVTRERGDFFRQ